MKQVQDDKDIKLSDKQKSYSKIYNVSEELSNDGLIWFNDTLEKVSKSIGDLRTGKRVVTHKFKITISLIKL